MLDLFGDERRSTPSKRRVGRDKAKDNARQRLKRKVLRQTNPELVRARRAADTAIEKAKRRPQVEARRLATEAKRQAVLVAKAQARVARAAAHAEKIRLKPWTDPALTPAQQWHMRYYNDPIFNMQERFRRHVRRGKFGKWDRLGCRLRDAMVEGREVQADYAPMIPYTAQALMAHLQRQFSKGMTWAKFCEGAIHIDHRIPLASFDMADEAQARAAWALTNLQPLWAPDNKSKHARRTVLL